jgi:hypothetical protein
MFGTSLCLHPCGDSPQKSSPAAVKERQMPIYGLFAIHDDHRRDDGPVPK